MKSKLSSELERPNSRYKLPCADGALAAFVMGAGIMCSALPFHEKAENLLSVMILVVLYIVMASEFDKAQG